ncbi:MAG: T9SS C-terminal target domain-containing protein [Calditrichaeota bacterium]|nr:MAG: T9SS C-terminal target domain-containing protein [Calditrichota bacterium]
MEEKMKLFISFLIFALPLLTQAEEFYYYKNDKIYIQESEKILIELHSINDNFVKSILVDNSELVKPFQKDTRLCYENYSRFLTLYEIEFLPNSSLLSRKEFIETLKQEPEIYSVFQAYNHEQNGMLVFGEMIVQFKPNVPRTEINKIITNNNLSVIEDSEFIYNNFVLKIAQGSESNFFETVNELHFLNQVEFAQPNFLIQNLLLANDPLFPQQWGMHNTGQNNGTPDADVDALETWDYITKGDTSLIIGVLDTGVDFTHPDLAADLLPGYNATNNGSTPPVDQPADGHGTATSGIAAGIGDNFEGIHGMAANCKIMPIKIFYPFVESATANAINFGWQNGADVLSNSWGGSAPSTALETAFNQAKQNGRNGLGCVNLASSGNNNNPNTNYPSGYASTISVGSMSPCYERKSMQSCDNVTNWGSSYGDQLNVVVPGTLIQTTDITGTGGYSNGNYTATFGGTSSACPLAAGIAACILSVDTTLTSDEVQDLMETTCEKVGNYSYNQTKANGSWDNEMGYGLVNAYEAVAKACKPETFNLLGPPDLTTFVVGTTIEFSWEKSLTQNKLDTINYELEISPNNTFNTITFSETITDTFYTWQAIVTPQIYSWRVTARSPVNGSTIVCVGESGNAYDNISIVQPTGPYLIYNSLVVNDQNEDNDGLADFYETVDLEVIVENVGIQNTSNTNGTITSTDPFVTIQNANASFAAVNAGDTSTVASNFTISVAGDTPDNHKAKFNLSITDGTETWNSFFFVFLHSPIFEFEETQLSEVTGNGDLLFQPNETGTVSIGLKNIGTGNAQNVNLSVSSFSANMIFQNEQVAISTIGSNDAISYSTTFQTSISQNATFGEEIPIEILITIGNDYSKTLQGILKIGERSSLLDVFSNNVNQWLFENDVPDNEWKMDSTASQIGNSSAYKSAPYSLNFNNGINFLSGLEPTNGTATSPKIDISNLANPVLRLWTLHDTEMTNDKDKRWIEISNNNFDSTVFAIQLDNNDLQQSWLSKFYNLDSNWGIIQVRFRFESVDNLGNSGKGWYIDNFIVADSPPTPNINLSQSLLYKTVPQDSVKSQTVVLGNTGNSAITYSIDANVVTFPNSKESKDYSNLLKKKSKIKDFLKSNSDLSREALSKIKEDLDEVNFKIGKLQKGATISGTDQVPWLNLSLSTGSISIGDFAFLNVQYVPLQITEGIYNAQIVITSNDPNSPTLIDVTMNVDNTPMEIGYIPPIVAFEDIQKDIPLADLVTEGNPNLISWTVEVNDPFITPQIIPFWNFLSISANQNYFTASPKQLILTATHNLGGDYWTDTTTVSILPINDPPTPFDILTPTDFQWIFDPPQNQVTFTWEKSYDAETLEPDYVIEMSNNQGFQPSELTLVGADTFTTVTFDTSGWVYWRVFVNDGEVEQLCQNFFKVVNVVLTTDSEENANLPTEFALRQNYPNPFNPQTKIAFSIPESQFTSLEIFNILGQKVKTLISQDLTIGNYEAVWNGTDKNGKLVSNGVYFYKMKSGNFSETKKMLFLK